MKFITKILKIFIYLLFCSIYFLTVDINYNFLEKSINNLNNVKIFYYFLNPLFGLSFMPFILLCIYGFNHKKTWFIVIFIITLKILLAKLPLYLMDTSDYLYSIFGILIYLILTSILIIKKIKIRKYICGALIVLFFMSLIFIHNQKINNTERQDCLEQKINIKACQEYYFMDRTFYEKLVEIESKNKKEK